MTQAYGAGNVLAPTFVLGWGQKVGLANNITTISDVYKITEQGLDVTDPGLNLRLVINADKDWIAFNNLPNGVRKYEVWYRAKTVRP